MSARRPSCAPLPSGCLSERFESGRAGPGAVSGGQADPGGASYGLYQLASRTGAVRDFLAAEGRPWQAELAAAAPGTAAFGAIWQAAAQRDPAGFAAAQRRYVARTHYQPVVAAVGARTGLDLAALPPAVGEVAWSCAVQHGAAARIIAAAVARAEAGMSRTAPGFAAALIAAIYAERAGYVRTVAARLSGPSRRLLLGMAERRYPAEQAAALALLAAP